MGKDIGSKNILPGSKRHLIGVTVTLIFLIGLAVFLFIKWYGSYTDTILYEERLGQMQEVTEQLFTGLEDVIENQWYNADVQTNRIMVQKPATEDELLAFLKEQAELSRLEESNSELIVLDDRGRYYTQNGALGYLSGADYLADFPDRISFVVNTSTKERTQMFFLEKLETPLEILDGDRKQELIYCGLARDMSELNQYFDCKAYDGTNAVYVLDSQGTKMFSGNNGSDFLEGFNVYTILQNMEYLHGRTFAGTLDNLENNGIAYSNAVLDGEESYYALYQMQNAAWILLFMVPSDVVAVNTVSLVNTTTRLVVVFAILMVMICTACIYWILRKHQQQVLAAEHRNREALEKMNADLAVAVEKAEWAEQVAKDASKAKSEFLSNMSHDIRTPMNAIVGLTRLMEHDKNDPEKLDMYLHKVQTSSKHLLSLLNDVLDMSKIEANEVALNREQVSLAEQVGQVDSIIRPQIEDRGQELIIRVQEIEHEYLVGDAVRLRQIIINLLSNAVKYTPRGGVITFKMRELPSGEKESANIEITVSDTGYGMTQEFMNHVFEPFTRAENSVTNAVQGTGLGMAITKKIVDLMGGTISVESQLGKGSCFRVTLPFQIDADAQYKVNAQNVLLISGEEILIRNASASFKKSGIPFYVARKLEEAEQLLQKQKMDTILIAGYLQDEQLSLIVQRLRELAEDAVLVFCVDYAQQELVADLLTKGDVDGLIARPFFFANFAGIVNHARTDTGIPKVKEGTALRGMHFLCAEDNKLNAEILEALLDINGASCDIYGDGKQIVEAFEQVQPGQYDAILMDVQMPNMNGLEATRAIRRSKNKLGRKIPIIAMTANAFSSDVQECIDSGMDAHVPKPLDIDTLDRTLRDLWNRMA